MTTKRREYYSGVFKEKMTQRLFGPNAISMNQLSKETGLSVTNLVNWKKKVEKGESLNDTPGYGKSKNKNDINLLAIFETHSMTELEVGAYCRRNGILTKDLKSWVEQGKDSSMINQLYSKEEKTLIQRLQEELKQTKIELASKNKELRRQEKALSKAAALILLSKKVEAIWADREED